MKMFYLELTEDELRANRGFMDAIVDAASGILNSLYGSYTPNVSDDEEIDNDDEDGGDE